MILYSKKELLVKVFHAYRFNIFKMCTIKLLKYFILLHRCLNISDTVKMIWDWTKMHQNTIPICTGWGIKYLHSYFQ